MSGSKEGKQFDSYRAVRQFERMFPRAGICGPGEERMTSDEYREHKLRQAQLRSQIDNGPKRKPFATITFYPDKEEVVVKRVI